MLPAPPVVLDGLKRNMSFKDLQHDHGTHVDVLDDGRIEPPVERVGWMALPWPGLEQVLNPTPPESYMVTMV